MRLSWRDVQPRLGRVERIAILSSKILANGLTVDGGVYQGYYFDYSKPVCASCANSAPQLTTLSEIGVLGFASSMGSRLKCGS